MKTPVFTGAAVAIITPMNADGSVNYRELGRIIDDQITNGTDAIVICGTTGESATLTHEEHSECIRFAVEHTARRVPVIAGTGSNDTAYAIKLSRHAEAVGADGLLLVTPYYNKASQAGLVAHFTAIAKSVSLPCILYNVPSRTGCNLLPATLAELAKLPNVNGVKEASGNLAQVADIAALCGDELNIYSGEDGLILPVLALELVHALFADVNPIPVKWAMNRLGWAAGPLRLPLCPPSPAVQQQLETALKNFGLLKD